MKKTTIGIGVLSIGALGLITFCVQPPDYPNEPVIEFKSVSRDLLYQSAFGIDSSIIITFSFTDGDGDIGFKENDPNQESIFIQDGRDTFNKPPLRIPYVDQQGAGNGISGEITMIVPNSCCIYDKNIGVPPCDTSTLAPQMRDTLFYYIQIKDRAGHLSNKVQTTPIVLICRRQ